MSAEKTSAQLCRENGWGLGTVLEGAFDPELGPDSAADRIEIVAIGKELVIAKRLAFKRRSGPWVACDWEKSWDLLIREDWGEGPWDLRIREWKAVEPEPAKEEWVASKDEEDWSYCEGPYASREAAIAGGPFDLVDEGVFEAGEAFTFYVGRQVPFVPRCSADHAIDQLACDAGDYGGVHADGWLSNLKIEAVADLQSRLDAALDGWIETHKLRPTFYQVDSIERHLAEVDPLPEDPAPQEGGAA